MADNAAEQARPEGAAEAAGTYELVIERLGAQGDGVARLDGREVFVPFALAGETVLAGAEGGAETAARMRLVDVVSASADRVAPVCRHFGACGGCAVQHLGAGAYAEWKRGLVVQALASRGLDVEVAPLVSVGAGARRRLILSAVRGPDGVSVGFHAAQSHEIVAVGMCPVADPSIEAALPDIARIVTPLVGGKDEVRISVLAADNGLDVDIAGGNRSLGPKARARLAGEAKAARLLRLSLDGDAVLSEGAPMIAMGRARVVPPPASFLQASAAAERLMAEAVVAALPKKAKRAADLFAGVGAFAFRLAERVSVFAVDSAPDALAALEEGARHAQGLKRIETRRRDLMGEPLSRKELEGFDLVVFDPPRAGAKAQAERLAKSQVPVVVAVSCNPGTLARDLRTLVDGGYRIGSVLPVDQFVYSPHVEAVAVLTR